MDLPRALRWGAITLVAGGLLTLGAAACGDDDDDDDDAADDGGDGDSAEEYFAAADALETDLDAVFESDTGSQNAVEFRDLLLEELDTYEQGFNDLDPPDDVQEAHDNYVEAIGAAVDAIERDTEDLTEEDPVDAVFEAFGSEEVAAVDPAQCELATIAEEKGIELETLSCPEEAVDPATLPAEETTDVLIEDFAFGPPHIQVSVGDTVTWTMGGDPEPHDATADDDSFAIDLLEEEGATDEVTFDTAGEFSYFCSIHPDMLGLVTVVE